MTNTRRLAAVIAPLAALAALALSAPAFASQVISTSTGTDIKLGVNDEGEAMLTYTSEGKVVRVLAWGAINANPSSPSKPQLKLSLGYDGGYEEKFKNSPEAKAALTNLRDLQAQMAKATAAGNNKLRFELKDDIAAAYKTIETLRVAATNYWQTFTCPKYDGPELGWLKAACKAPDGSYWAVQSWQRLLPNYGVASTPKQEAWEVHLAHWDGDPPVLTIDTDWSFTQWEHLFGSFTYRGKGVFGYRVTPDGQPLDTYGRNLYVDTLDSVYGTGWKRENSFLAHNPTGVFCYSINPHPPHPAGNGSRYRATISGPGLTPDMVWEGASPGPYDKAADAIKNLAIAALNDKLCKPN